MKLSYSIDIDGSSVEIFLEDSKCDKTMIKRYTGYYTRFLQQEIGIKDDNQKYQLLTRIVNALSDDGIIDMMTKLKDDQGREAVVDSVKELIDAYQDEPLDDFEEIEINGNRFSYLKTLNIESIRSKLHDVGNEVKGRKWRVELDEEGKVVLCE